MKPEPSLVLERVVASLLTEIAPAFDQTGFVRERMGADTINVVPPKGLVLLKADPSGHHELAKLPALEGKTWNHPVLVGDRLYVRNSQEAACYQLPLLGNAGTAGRAGPADPE